MRGIPGITPKQLVVITVIAGFVLLMPDILGPYYTSILNRAVLFSIAAATVGVLWGQAGVLTFSQGAFFGIGVYAVAIAMTHFGLTAEALLGAVVGGLLAAGLISAFVGWLAFWYGASAIYIAVVTLVVPIALVEAVYAASPITGASTGLSGFSVPPVSQAAWFRINAFVLLCVGLGLYRFVKSDYGVVLRAIRDNEDRLRYLGIETLRIKKNLFIVMALVAAAGGFLFALSTRSAAPEHLGFVFGTELVVFTALGGRLTILGPILGTIGLEWLGGYVSSALPFAWRLIVGTLFVVVILLLPAGLVPAVSGLITKTRNRSASGKDHQNASDVDRAEFRIRTTDQAIEQANTTQSGDLALEILNVTKSYGSLSVLSDINVKLGLSELVGVVGPNGAGKTTLMRCISDGRERTNGKVSIFSSEVGRRSPASIVDLGLGRSFQNTSLFPSLTVAEALSLARARRDGISPRRRSSETWLPEMAKYLLDETGLNTYLDESIDKLSHGQKRVLELVCVMALEPRLLLLDEPTAGLTKSDREMVGNLLVDLQTRYHLGVLLIEHDFEFVQRICSRLIVLHNGKIVLDGAVDRVVSDPLIQEIYSG